MTLLKILVTHALFSFFERTIVWLPSNQLESNTLGLFQRRSWIIIIYCPIIRKPHSAYCRMRAIDYVILIFLGFITTSTTELGFYINVYICTMDNIEASRLKNLKREEIINDIINIARQEHKKGNKTVTQERINQLLDLANLYKEENIPQKREVQRDQGNKIKINGLGDSKTSSKVSSSYDYPSLYSKIKIKKNAVVRNRRKRHIQFQFDISNIERIIIEFLETLANLLDNLHLLSLLRMFPKKLSNLLKQTNKLWVILLLFLIRKTISQLLNVMRKQKKVQAELTLLRLQSNSKLIVSKEDEDSNNNIFRKYEKVLKDLRFDKMMLTLELIGNLLDMTFNLIELYNITFPPWVMSILNFASLSMTIYRMNKDDEYLDDDITEDLI